MNRSALLLALLLPILGCPDGSDDAAPKTSRPASEYDADAIPVKVAAAARGDVVRTLELGGIAEAWRSARLAPSAQGVVETLNVQLGDSVKEGQLLAAIDTTALDLQHQAAQRAVDLARIQLRDAEAEAKRARTLVESGAITTRDADKAELGFELAQAQIEQAQAQAASLQGQIRLARVVAPFAGRITSLTVEKGEFFSSMSGMGGAPTLLELQALDPIKVDVQISEADLSRVTEGMEVNLESDAYPDQRFTGTVTLVNAAASAGTRTFLVRIRVPNPDGLLRPGMFLRARLKVDQREDVVSVPPQAITRTDDGNYVMVVADATASRRSVQPGLRGDGSWEVQGLEPGESVVVDGQFGLPDGARVRVIGER